MAFAETDRRAPCRVASYDFCPSHDGHGRTAFTISPCNFYRTPHIAEMDLFSAGLNPFYPSTQRSSVQGGVCKGYYFLFNDFKKLINKIISGIDRRNE